jgi:hypothetical protein
MTFQFKYQNVIRKPNPMTTINPLRNGTGKMSNIDDRVNTLAKSAVWQKTIKTWKAQGKTFDLSRAPKFSYEKLVLIDIAEDIQRALSDKHCANKIGHPDLFDPALLQPIQCIKTSKGKFISVNSQHTAATIAGLIDAGLMPGHSDWREFEWPFWYIETDNLAFARRAFGIHNGKGSKPQSKYLKLRNSVFVVRLDKDESDQTEVALEKKVTKAEQYNCFPVEERSPLARYPGTFTNIATFESLNLNEIGVACSWHDKYFHYETVHASLYFIYRDLCREFASAKLPISNKLKLELAALIQNLFGNLSQYQESVTEAHRRWHTKRFGYKGVWNDDAYACALIHLYRKFGGQEKVAPTLEDRFNDLVKFFDQDILSLAS